MNTLTRYRTYSSVEEAEAVAGLLRNAGIRTEIVNNRQPLGSIFVGTTLDNMVELQIPSGSFKKADELLLNAVNSDINLLDKNYYLFAFSDQELVEILSKPDEWSEQDFLFAKEILKTRGVEYTAEELSVLKQKRIDLLSKSQSSAAGWLIAAFVFLLIHIFTGILLFGVLAVLSPLIVWRAKKVLPDGRKVPMYQQQSSQIAAILFFMSLMVFLGHMVARIYFGHYGSFFPVNF
jgi:hypothetical protein